MPLERLQEFTDQPDRLSAVAISNAGGVEDGLPITDAVVAAVQPALEGQGLAVQPVKQEMVAEADVLVALGVVGSGGDEDHAGWDVQADVHGTKPIVDFAGASASKGG